MCTHYFPFQDIVQGVQRRGARVASGRVLEGKANLSPDTHANNAAEDSLGTWCTREDLGQFIPSFVRDDIHSRCSQYRLNNELHACETAR